jgi:hypothetical protein
MQSDPHFTQPAGSAVTLMAVAFGAGIKRIGMRGPNTVLASTGLGPWPAEDYADLGPISRTSRLPRALLKHRSVGFHFCMGEAVYSILQLAQCSELYFGLEGCRFLDSCTFVGWIFEGWIFEGAQSSALFA